MTDDPRRHGLTGRSAAARRQVEEDNRALREADERVEQKWSTEMASKIKKTAWGPATRPPSTNRADEGLDNLGGLINDIADAVREAQAREQVLAESSVVEPGRFPVIGGGGQR